MSPPVEIAKIQAALRDVQNKLSIRKAAERHGLSKSLLHKRVHLNSSSPTLMGRPKILSEDEEARLYNWIVLCANRGNPRTLKQVLDAVNTICDSFDRRTHFKRERATYGWLHAFLDRRQGLKRRKAMSVTTANAFITEKSLRLWHARQEKYLKENGWLHILNSPEKVFNADETYLAFTLRQAKVVVPKQQCRVARKGPDAKAHRTVMFTINAAGHMLEPYILYPLDRLPPMPPGVQAGKNSTGWMTITEFLDYLEKVFASKIRAGVLKGPLILFVDGHSSHFSLEISEFCELYEIILIALYPNATHILQPLDVAVFKIIKSCWDSLLIKKSAVDFEFSINNHTFAKLLAEFCIKYKDKLVSSAQEGFEDTGLYPYDVEGIKFEKLLESCRMREPDSKENCTIICCNDDPFYEEGKLKFNYIKTGF